MGFGIVVQFSELKKLFPTAFENYKDSEDYSGNERADRICEKLKYIFETYNLSCIPFPHDDERADEEYYRIGIYI